MFNKVFFNTPKKPTSIPFDQSVKKYKRLLWVGLFIFALTSLSLMNPYSQEAFNETFKSLFPNYFSPFLLLTSVGVFIGCLSMERSEVAEKSFKFDFRRDMIKNTTLRFRCFFREDTNGSIWEITNISEFDWDKAILLIEQKEGRKIVGTEKYHLNQVKKKGKVAIHSNFTASPSSKWRVMVLTKEGYHIIFPDFLKRFDIKKAKKFIIENL